MTQPRYPLCIAVAPISWGAGEVFGWGHVHTEMAALGIAATDLGLPSYLPRNPAESRSLLDDFDVTSTACHRTEHDIASGRFSGTAEPRRRRPSEPPCAHRFRAGLSPICLGPICLGPNLDGK